MYGAGYGEQEAGDGVHRTAPHRTASHLLAHALALGLECLVLIPPLARGPPGAGRVGEMSRYG